MTDHFSKPDSGRKVEYKGTITLGNILTMVTMLGTLVSLYLAHDTRITRLEFNGQHQGEQITITLTMINRIVENQEQLTRSVDRLNYQLETRKK